jgi:hypothetical protein
MADTYSISAAARLCRVDRKTIQRAIHAGRLHLDAQHQVSREALLAGGYLVQDTPHPSPQAPGQGPPHATPQDTPLAPLLERLILAIEGLTQALQYPHTAGTAPVPQATPQTPQATPQPRGQLRPQILALFQRHPEGLSAVQVRQLLGSDKDLSDTVVSMRRDGLLVRLKHGVYGLPDTPA